MKDMLDSYPMPTGVNLFVSTVVHVTYIYLDTFIILLLI